MSTPLFFPPATVVPRLSTRAARTLRELLELAGLQCKATGPWTQRRVVIAPGESFIVREAGDWGAVVIGVPEHLSGRDQARFAVAAMAYGLMDVVARESIRGAAWARPSPPRGRPAIGTAATGAQRQRAYRARQARAG